jgi:hypothetical protein
VVACSCGAITGSAQDNGGKLEGGIVGDGKTTVGRKFLYSGVHEIALDNTDEIRNFLR